MMMVLSIVSLCTGAILAQRFKVYVLVPACAAVVTPAIGTMIMLVDSLWSAALAVAAAVASMQVGYFVGLSVKNRLSVRFRFTSRLSPFSHPVSRNPVR
jgi:hypothetical protein